jgi:predicted transcriptional regulator
MRAKTRKKTARVAASVPPKAKRTIRRIASETDMSESRIIQEAITRFIDDYGAGRIALFTPRK